MRNAEKIKKSVYAGLTKDEYKHIEKAILRNSRHSIITGSFVAAVLLLILVLASFGVGSLAKNRMLYIGLLIPMAVVYVISRIFLKKYPQMTHILDYAFLSIIFIFGIILGVPLSPNTTAVTFCVMIFALPLLISDKPYRIDAVLTAYVLIFCYATLETKPRNVATIDITNALSFLFLSFVVSYHVTKSRFNGLLMRSYVEKERDTDDLTKLMTKAAFRRETDLMLSDTKMNGALLIIDVDNFKSVNDTMGHAYGDAVLRIMGECIRESFCEDSLKGRFGGDEFTIFIPNKSNRESVEQEVTQLVSSMNSKLSSADNPFSVTGSIGIALFPPDAMEFDTLFKYADEALYESKKKGKNCYTFYLDRNMLGE